VLALTFADPASYDLIGEDDTISILGLAGLAPDESVRCRINRSEGSSVEFEVTHTLSDDQIEWFYAGSALNIIRQKRGG
jgi:aconitate hydratase